MMDIHDPAQGFRASMRYWLVAAAVAIAVASLGPSGCGAGSPPHEQAELPVKSRQTILLHITTRDAWDRARSEGSYRPESLTTEGFIHLSTPEQVVGTANTFYKGQHGLVLLHVDAARVRSAIRWESPKDSTEQFPHIYGPLNLDAVVEVEPYEPSEDGTFGPPASQLLSPHPGMPHP